MLAGHDPCGGAGIQADIEAIAAAGGHALPVITSLTIQNTCNVQALRPLDADWVLAQAHALLDDIPIDAVKIGLLGSVEIVAAVAHLVSKLSVPVVLDPVLAAGGGSTLASDAVCSAIREQLLMKIDLLTPNRGELRRLSTCENLDNGAEYILAQGCTAVLVTGADEAEQQVCNTLYRPQQPPQHWHWPYLAACYHGSGCTLASAIAVRLAQGQDLPSAVGNAQDYTWHSLLRGYAIGQGQHLPRRLP